jgi:hypothetical protein
MLDKKIFELREQNDIYIKCQEIEKERLIKISEINEEFQNKIRKLQNECKHEIDGISALKFNGHPNEYNSKKRFCVICCKSLTL